MQPDDYFVEIISLTADIGKLETERDELRRELDKAMVFAYQFDADLRERWRKENESKFLRYEELNREIDFKRQKLISLELGSIAASSQQFNKSIGRMNDSVNKSISDLNDSIGSLKIITDDSMKSLNTTTQKLLDSSTTLEILTGILIIVSIVSLTVTLIPLSSYYAFVGLLIAGAAIYLLILLLIRVIRKRFRKAEVGGRASSAPVTRISLALYLSIMGETGRVGLRGIEN